MGCADELESATLAALLALVRQHTGIAMTERKSVLLQGRLQPRVRELGLGGYGDYLALLQRGGTEVERFINMVTTNDTLFFRTPAVWDWFATTFLPAWRREHGGQCLRLWSAAAATGEEAYSMAMLCQQFQQAHPEFRYKILGTDISTDALATAGAGQYGGRSVERLRASHPAMVARYFVAPAKAGDAEGSGAIAVVPELKQHVQFAPHNLFDGFRPAQQFDLVFLRNVLIYFDEDNQRRVLGKVRAAMAPHARLVLGEQESITRLATPLRFEQTHVYLRGEDHVG